MTNPIRKSWYESYFLLSGIAAGLLGLALIFIRSQTGNYITTDSQDYYNITEYIAGVLMGTDVSHFEFMSGFNPGPDNISVPRLFRIIVPLFAVLPSFINGVVISYFFVDLIFITLTSFIIYLIAKNLGLSPFEIYAAAQLFSTSFYVFSWGISILVETGTWFFVAVSVLMGVCLWKGEQKDSLLSGVIFGLISNLGLLTKEFVISGVLFICLWLNKNYSHKWKKSSFCTSGLCCSCPSLLYKS